MVSREQIPMLVWTKGKKREVKCAIFYERRSGVMALSQKGRIAFFAIMGSNIKVHTRHKTRIVLHQPLGNVLTSMVMRRTNTRADADQCA